MSSVGRVLILITRYSEGQLQIADSISDDPEFSFVQQMLSKKHPNPLEAIRQRRRVQYLEEEAFADYIESLVSAPGCALDVRDHAGRWFLSRIHLEKYRQAEAEARQVIVDYAFRVFLSDPNQTDFILASAHAQVRVLIHVVEMTKVSVA
jgi:hypothetical protein